MSDFEPRRATAGAEFSTTDSEGNQRTLRADDDGIVRPKTAADVALLDSFDLPVARKALEADKEADASPRRRETKGA